MHELKGAPFSGLILASQSPRRLALLKQLCPNWPIEQIGSDIDEDRFYELSAIERCTRLAQLKAECIAQAQNKIAGKAAPTSKLKPQLIIAADTEVVLNTRSLGKPSNHDDAIAMLQALSAKRHDVITGFCIIHSSSGQIFTSSVSTAVWFKALNQTMIRRYVASGEPMDKAGSYGLQGLGAALVEKVDGSYSNVVGLPLETLYDALNDQFGFEPWL